MNDQSIAADFGRQSDWNLGTKKKTLKTHLRAHDITTTVYEQQLITPRAGLPGSQTTGTETNPTIGGTVQDLRM